MLCIDTDDDSEVVEARRLVHKIESNDVPSTSCSQSGNRPSSCLWIDAETCFPGRFTHFRRQAMRALEFDNVWLVDISSTDGADEAMEVRIRLRITSSMTLPTVANTIVPPTNMMIPM